MSEEWRWVPVSEPPTGCNREIGMLYQDGQKEGGWFWPDHSVFSKGVTHWCEMLWPPDPEPPKSDIQRVCEWLGVSARDGCYSCYLEKDALLWRIEEAIEEREWIADARKEDGAYWCTLNNGYGRVHVAKGTTRAEALLKAALWVMEQEES